MRARPVAIVTLAGGFIAASADARVVNVATTGELAAAVAAAAPGDDIVLADGNYDSTGLTCAAVASPAQPIVVRAAHPLAARVRFDAVEGFKVTGASWHFEGLDVRGVCASDASCEHAFHVFGAADDFVLRHCLIADFNSQLKVNAAVIGSAHVAPNRGVVEYNEVFDGHPRATTTPVNKINIDTGDDWIVRGNYIHDNHAQGGISYAAFMKSGGHRGVMERNLVICSKDDTSGDTRIGLSFGGGGTGAQFCAPAYDPNVPCAVEHSDGTMRNNIIVNCSDVGIYINRGASSHVLYNTLIATAGIDFRFATTTGEAIGNVLASTIHPRDGGTFTGAANRDNVDAPTFASWYRAPLAGDLVAIGDVTSLIGAGPARADVVDDYCTRVRPQARVTIGAIEHSLGGCETTRPPEAGGGSGGGDGGAGGDAGPFGDPVHPGGGGCCGAAADPASAAGAAGVLALMLRRRRRGR